MQSIKKVLLIADSSLPDNVIVFRHPEKGVFERPLRGNFHPAVLFEIGQTAVAGHFEGTTGVTSYVSPTRESEYKAHEEAEIQGLMAQLRDNVQPAPETLHPPELLDEAKRRIADEQPFWSGNDKAKAWSGNDSKPFWGGG